MKAKNKPTFLGTVQSVKGVSISVRLRDDFSSGLSFVEGQAYRIGQVGSFVRIPVGFVDLFGVVSQIGADAIPETLSGERNQGNNWLTVQLLGEGAKRGKFQRGISQYPTIDDEVHLVSEKDLGKIYGHESNQNYLVRVGHIAGSESIDALVDINKLVTRHSAVVGSTGSGKSTTVASILNSLSDKERFPSARILILDIHGEYGKALNDRATIFKINPNPKSSYEKLLSIPYWALNFDELLSVSLGIRDDKERGQILDKIYELKKHTVETARLKDPEAFEGVDLSTLNVDSPIPFSIKRLWLYLNRLVNSTHTVKANDQVNQGITEKFDLNITTEAFKIVGGKPQTGDEEKVIPPIYQAANGQTVLWNVSNLSVKRPLENLASKLRDPRYGFLFAPGCWEADSDGQTAKDLDALMEEWIGIKNPISILDLSGVPSILLKDMIGILLRILYEGLFWAKNLPEGGRERPLLVVMEEAHSYLNDDLSGLASSIVQKIVKEGRKYGIGAMIVSQRPSEINPTILSQCGTFFALRLTNQSDRSHIQSVITDNLDSLTNMLPILRTGEAIILGEAVKLPMRTNIEAPPKDRRPDSQDPLICSEVAPEMRQEEGGWEIKSQVAEDYTNFVKLWRSQNPKLIEPI